MENFKCRLDEEFLVLHFIHFQAGGKWGSRGGLDFCLLLTSVFLASTEEILASAGDGKLVHDSQKHCFIFNVLPIFCMFCIYKTGNFWTTKMLRKKR